jgi:hypothetical protein
MSGRPELDLKDFWELRLDLIKKVLHFIRVLDQGINRSREQVLHTSSRTEPMDVGSNESDSEKLKS